MLGSLARNHDLHPDATADPLAGFKTLYFDSVLFEAEALKCLAALAGPERIMLGSDYPFPIGDPDPCGIVHRCGFAEPAANAILGDTAQEIFKIEA